MRARLIFITLSMSAGVSVPGVRAQNQSDAISREFTVYVDDSTYPAIEDSWSREFTVYVGTQPLRVQTDAITDEFTVFFDAGAAGGITDTNSREFTVYNGTQPLRQQTDAVSREFTAYADPLGTVIFDAISLEFTTYVGTQPLREIVDAVTREFSVYVGEFQACILDLNTDGTVNLADFELVATCLNGPAVPNLDCSQVHFNRVDFDDDGDFDMADFAHFQIAIGAVCP